MYHTPPPGLLQFSWSNASTEHCHRQPRDATADEKAHEATRRKWRVAEDGPQREKHCSLDSIGVEAVGSTSFKKCRWRQRWEDTDATVAEVVLMESDADVEAAKHMRCGSSSFSSYSLQ